MDGAVFLDIDGTIVEDRGHPRDESGVVFYPETFNALIRLQRELRLFIVTTRPGAADGTLTDEEAGRVNRQILPTLGEYGIETAEAHVRPRRREDGRGGIEPQPGFFGRAVEEHGIDRERSYAVGKPPNDAKSSHAGMPGVYVLTFHGEEEECAREWDAGAVLVRGIREAADWILIHKAFAEGGPSLRAAIEEAAAGIQSGGLAAVPTETVYGLAADATDTRAVARIFELKGRPAFDPLIVHVTDITHAEPLVGRIPAAARRLANRFWPGPLTLVLPKSDRVPDIVTAGLPTVAVRAPDHPLALALIKESGAPLAAPSANLFGRTSPTTAGHVRAEFGDAVGTIVPGGPCRVGVESTIVSFADDPPRLLRPGGLPVEDIEREIGPILHEPPRRRTVQAPGMLPRHYAPRTPLLLSPPAEERDWRGKRAGRLALRTAEKDGRWAETEILSESGNLSEAAANLFSALRRLDAAGLDVIVAEPVPETGLGRAIMDRLRRAAHKDDAS